VQDPELRRRVVDEGIDIYLSDNVDAWTLGADGAWTKQKPRGRERGVCAQHELLSRLRDKQKP
jgi:polyphosphate kinase